MICGAVSHNGQIVEPATRTIIRAGSPSFDNAESWFTINSGETGFSVFCSSCTTEAEANSILGKPKVYSRAVIADCCAQGTDIRVVWCPVDVNQDFAGAEGHCEIRSDAFKDKKQLNYRPYRLILLAAFGLIKIPDPNLS